MLKFHIELMADEYGVTKLISQSLCMSGSSQVIFPGYDYKTALINGGVDTLRSRREELTRRFFVRRAERDILSSLLAATKARREHYHET